MTVGAHLLLVQICLLPALFFIIAAPLGTQIEIKTLASASEEKNDSEPLRSQTDERGGKQSIPSMICKTPRELLNPVGQLLIQLRIQNSSILTTTRLELVPGVGRIRVGDPLREEPLGTTSDQKGRRRPTGSLWNLIF